MTDLIEQFVEDLSFDALISWADTLGIEHDENQWLDDEWPRKDNELRVRVSEAIEAVGLKEAPKTCKWKWVATNGDERLYNTTCYGSRKRGGPLVWMQEHSTFCPFCGGKIVEVK